jgi:hypothetical protein
MSELPKSDPEAAFDKMLAVQQRLSMIPDTHSYFISKSI